MSDAFVLCFSKTYHTHCTNVFRQSYDYVFFLCRAGPQNAGKCAPMWICTCVREGNMRFYASRKKSREHIVAGLSVRPSVRPSVSPYVPNPCPAHNFVIWSPNLKLFHINDHYIETMCRVQICGHSMTLQQYRVRLITVLFKVGF